MQHVAIEVGRMLGTAAQPFTNITAYDGVLVQGTVAEEGEVSSAHNINAVLCHDTKKACRVVACTWIPCSAVTLT